MNLLLGFFLSAIPLLIMIGIVVFALRKLSHRTQPVDSTEQPVRLFFQYALAFGLFIIFTVGIAGLLSRILDTANIVNADQSSLARGPLASSTRERRLFSRARPGRLKSSSSDGPRGTQQRPSRCRGRSTRFRSCGTANSSVPKLTRC